MEQPDSLKKNSTIYLKSIYLSLPEAKKMKKKNHIPSSLIIRQMQHFSSPSLAHDKKNLKHTQKHVFYIHLKTEISTKFP